MPRIPSLPVNKFQFCQVNAKRHLIQFGRQQDEAIHWTAFGERTRDQLVELRNRIKSQSTPVPFVIEELATPIPNSIMFAGTSVFLGEGDMPGFLEKLEHYLQLLDDGHAPACERDPFDQGV